MHFEIRRANTLWAEDLRSEADPTIAEADRTYPSAAEVSAAALAFAHLVGPSSGTLF
ncbi:hypothetical protein MKK84_08800 [Methylobacterium sp. E-065]|uniref:hypothetical protein n=1 Tax=Methylobacterium sp. E-065 TaxID=2836583 RepID=UPI001FB917DC|nr:hypothetical protein [Methylobacterium sp. E-065]MCJ2017514.1 hypothetical protein [Methylobacterium sp. E-065]